MVIREGRVDAPETETAKKRGRGKARSRPSFLVMGRRAAAAVVRAIVTSFRTAKADGWMRAISSSLFLAERERETDRAKLLLRKNFFCRHLP